MNNLNLALNQEQEQRIDNDRYAVEVQIDQETDLYLRGQADAVFGVDPTNPKDQNYWQGYQEALQQQWIKRTNPMPPCFGERENQGIVIVTYDQLRRQYGDIWDLGEDQDYKGWEIELNCLTFEIATLDWEDYQKETEWTIYSVNPDALKFVERDLNVVVKARDKSQDFNAIALSDNDFYDIQAV